MERGRRRPASEEEVGGDRRGASVAAVEADQQVGSAVAVGVAGDEPGSLALVDAKLPGGGRPIGGESVGADEAERLVAGDEAVGVDPAEVELVVTGNEVLDHVERSRGRF